MSGALIVRENTGLRGGSWRKYAKVFALGLQEQMEYRFNTFLESLVGVGSFVVILFLWASIFSSGGGEAMGGMTLPQMLTYLLLSRFWDWVQNPGAELDSMMPEDIRNGGMSKVLARPISDRYYRLCLFFSHRILSGVVRALPVAALMLILPGLFSVSLGPRLFVLPLVMLLSLLLQFTFSYMAALAAFWFLSIGGLLFLKRIVVSFLAGAWIPLVLLPQWAQDASGLLPFQYMVFFPVQLALNRMSWNGVLRGCMVMNGWIVVLWVLGAILWKRGLQRYSAAGM
jgi:ABC-2 type transport system permease protein